MKSNGFLLFIDQENNLNETKETIVEIKNSEFSNLTAAVIVNFGLLE